MFNFGKFDGSVAILILRIVTRELTCSPDAVTTCQQTLSATREVLINEPAKKARKLEAPVRFIFLTFLRRGRPSFRGDAAGHEDSREYV